jgi:hypothetical protein
MFSDGLDGVERSLPDVGILLIAELLLEGLDGPVHYNQCQQIFLGLNCDRQPRHRRTENKIESNFAKSKGKKTGIMTER